MFSISSSSSHLCLALLSSRLREPWSPGKSRDNFGRPSPREAAGPGPGRLRGAQAGGGGALTRGRGRSLPGAGAPRGERHPRGFSQLQWVQGCLFLVVKLFPSPTWGYLGDKGAHPGPAPTPPTRCPGGAGAVCVLSHAAPPCLPALLHSLRVFLPARVCRSVRAAGVGGILPRTHACANRPSC